MKRDERVREILRLEALAAAAKRKAAQHRDDLAAEACAELEREGTAPSWRLRDIGTVVLPLSEEAAVVSDVAALAKWVELRHPTEIETVKQIRAAFQTALLQRLVCTDDVVVDPDTGEVVPGLVVRPGGVPKTLTITASRDAKAVFAAHGDQLLDAILAAEAEPVGHLAPGEVA